MPFYKKNECWKWQSLKESASKNINSLTTSGFNKDLKDATAKFSSSCPFPPVTR